MPSPWPTVHRAQLGDAVSSFEFRRGAILVGETGVGKSQLARDVRSALDRAHSDRYLWLFVTGSLAESGIPLSALDGLLTDVAVSSQQTARHIAGLVHEQLRLQAGDRQIAVLVDDIHLLDTVSADVLAYLCRLTNIVLLGTVRSGRTPADSIVSLWREDVLSRVDVLPFTAGEVREVVWAALEGPVDSDLVRELFQSSDGNPMYVRELVRAGLAEGTIVRRHGTWIREGRSIPAKRLADLIRAELVQLPALEREAVELIALSEPVAVPLTQGLIDDAVLDRLVSDGVVRVEDGPANSQFSTQALRLSHPIYAECVRNVITPRRRRALYEALYCRTPRVWAPHHTLSGFLRWTAWTLECGLDIAATDLVRAARAATSLGRFELAIDAAGAAFDRSEDTQTAVEALAIRARELHYRDRAPDALRDVDAALRLLRSTSSSLDESMADLILSIHELRADIQQYGLDDPAGALATIDRVYLPLVVHGDRSAHAQRYRISRIAHRGWAGDLAAPLTIADELGDDQQAVAPVMLALTWAGRSTETMAIASHYTAADTPLSPYGDEIGLMAFFSHLMSGRLVQARDLAPDPRSFDETTRLDPAVTYAGAARLLAAEGRWREADELFLIARQLFEVRDPHGLKAWSMAGEAFCATQIGADDRARELILRINRTPWRASRGFEADIRAQTISALLTLRDPRAADKAAALEMWAREHHFHLVELWALDLVALADPQSVRAGRAAERLTALSTLIDAPIAAPMISHVRAIIDADADLEVAAAAQLSQHGHWVPRRSASLQLLSRRESEIASLVAAGLSSPAIAERLHLSARTVEAHVSRVFLKLGVNRRSQLADALRLHSV